VGLLARSSNCFAYRPSRAGATGLHAPGSDQQAIALLWVHFPLVALRTANAFSPAAFCAVAFAVGASFDLYGVRVYLYGVRVYLHAPLFGQQAGAWGYRIALLSSWSRPFFAGKVARELSVCLSSSPPNQASSLVHPARDSAYLAGGVAAAFAGRLGSPAAADLTAICALAVVVLFTALVWVAQAAAI
jgi:hypothetical protein